MWLCKKYDKYQVWWQISEMRSTNRFHTLLGEEIDGQKHISARPKNTILNLWKYLCIPLFVFEKYTIKTKKSISWMIHLTL